MLSLPRSIAALAAASLVVIAILNAYTYISTPREGGIDEATLAQINGYGLIRSYEMHVQTEAALDDRTLSIDGIYRIDEPRRRYASHSTTTLRIPGSTEPHSFSLKNVSIDDAIYTKIDTTSPLLEKTIPHSEEWRQFTSNSIPSDFADIAVFGPVLDNLRLFSDNGRYLTFEERLADTVYAGTSFARYRFSSREPDARPGGTLESLLARIGREGSVEVWLSGTSLPFLIRVESVGYRSTTTITNMNPIQEIEAPTTIGF